MEPFYESASFFSKIALSLLFPALAIHCAGYATPNWMKSHSISELVNVRVGLWKMSNCSNNTACVESSIPDDYKSDLLTVTQAFESAVLVFIGMTIIMSICYVTSPAARIQAMAVGIMLLCFSSLALSISGTIVWIFNLPDRHYPSISMGLTLIAASLCMLSGTLMIPDIRKYDYDGIKKKEITKHVNKKKRRTHKEHEWQIPVD